jgi:DNA polymerase III alpha subunit
MGFLEGQGLVKMDFLGLKTLDLIGNTEDLIR